MYSIHVWPERIATIRCLENRCAELERLVAHLRGALATQLGDDAQVVDQRCRAWAILRS